MELRTNGLRIELYDDIDVMPSERYNKFNKYVMISEQLGSDFSDIDGVHLSRIARTVNDKGKFVAEFKNFRNMIYNIIEEFNPKCLAFACLVKSIDGVPVTDLSESNLKEVSARVPWGEIKKKFVKQGRKLMIS